METAATVVLWIIAIILALNVLAGIVGFLGYLWWEHQVTKQTKDIEQSISNVQRRHFSRASSFRRTNMGPRG